MAAGCNRGGLQWGCSGAAVGCQTLYRQVAHTPLIRDCAPYEIDGRYERYENDESDEVNR